MEGLTSDVTFIGITSEYITVADRMERGKTGMFVVVRGSFEISV